MPKVTTLQSKGASKRIRKLRKAHRQLVDVAARAQRCADDVAELLRAAETELASATLDSVSATIKTAETKLADAGAQILLAEDLSVSRGGEGSASEGGFRGKSTAARPGRRRSSLARKGPETVTP